MTETRKHPLAACEVCPLRDRPFVPSYEPTQPVAAIVGEAPGYDEAKQGLPFVGVSGQLLERVSKHIGLEYEQVYRTNAVLCHPYQNATPGTLALRCCAPRLEAELAALPDVPVIAMGGVATEALDSLTGQQHEGGITKRRGGWYPSVAGRQYLATLHPAYVLRNPAQVRLLIDDLTKGLRDHNTAPKDWLAVQVELITAERVDELIAYLDIVPDDTPVSFDVETRGLQWWDTYERSGADLLCLVLTDSTERAYIIPADVLLYDHPQHGQYLLAYLESFFKRVYPIAHNGKFDELVLRRHDMWVHTRFDTMLASFALNEIKGYNGLKYLASSVLGAPDYEELVLTKEFLELPSEKKDYGKIPKDRLYKYAAIDGCVTLALAAILDARLDEDGVRSGFEVLMRGHQVATDAGWHGIKVDTDYLSALGEALEDQQVDLTQALYSLVCEASASEVVIGPPYYKADTIITEPYSTEKKGTKAFNPGSTAQMSYIIYRLLGLQPQGPLGYKVKEGSTADEVLEALPPHPFVKGLQQYRTITKLINTYIRKIIAIADTNDRVHINFNLNGTETGRLSADDSQHGIPRATDFYGKGLRGAYIAEEGCKIVQGDYSQAELRAIAAESGEAFFLDAFNMPPEKRHEVAAERYGADYEQASDKEKAALAKLATDVHSRTAMFLFDNYEKLELASILDGSEEAAAEAKELRTFAKNFNFGNVYQGGVSGIWSMTGGKLSKPRVSQLLTLYHSKTPTLQAYCKQQFRKAKTEGYVITRMGRKRRFPLLVHDNIDEVRKASVNMPIQSMASDLTLLAAYQLGTMGYKVVHMIHDSILLEVPEQQVPLAVKHLEETMVAVGCSYFPEVAWEADIEVADRWYQKRPDLRQGVPPIRLS